MANEVWQEIKRYWGKVSPEESNRESDICRVCGHDKSEAKRNKKGQTACETAEVRCKENKEVQDIIMVKINKKIGKRTPMSGGRDRRVSAYKHDKGAGTTAKSSTAAKKFALKKGTRPGQKSSVQKAKTRAAQRAGKRQDAFVGKARKMSGGRGRSYSGQKLS